MGLNFTTSSRKASSWLVANCAFVVSGFGSFDVFENERLRVCAAGVVGDVRKAREEAFVEDEGERMVLS